jgi:NADH:ubiquinone oxidoreductase subunit 2 (subunit N)
LLQLKKKSIVKNNKELNDLILLKKSNPALAILFSLILFSIAGIPPCIFYIYFK